MLTVLRKVTELVDWRLGELKKGRSSKTSQAQGPETPVDAQNLPRALLCG